MNPPLAQMFDGMQYMPFIALTLAVTFFFSLISILLALLRRPQQSTKIARLCMGLSIALTFLWLILLGDNLTLLGYAISLCPFVLGWDCCFCEPNHSRIEALSEQPISTIGNSLYNHGRGCYFRLILCE